jgi:hypothetical protein
MTDNAKTASEPQVCPTCGTRLPIATPPEFCPACLLQAGLRSEEGMHPTGTICIQPDRPNPSDRTNTSKGLPRAGEQFGPCKLLRLLGGGGMGVVYEAEEIDSSRRVALKLLGQALDSPEARKRFLREGQLAAAINHPNSVYVFGTDEIAGTPVIFMELMSGGTLHDRVAASGPVPISEAVDSILQVMAGLEAAQHAGILHRDIKPSNCFVDADGTVKIGDFGLSISSSVRLEPGLTATGRIMGTPAFSSPEQLRGDELTARSDIYAVGVTLYFLLTGRTPFQASNFVQMLATVLENKPEAPAKLRKEIPAALSAAILRCLEKDPGERFPNYTQLRETLLPFATTPFPAALGRRFFAGFVDLTVIGGIAQILESGIPLGFTPFYPLVLLYFTLTEGAWGVSLGKRILHLQIVSVSPKAFRFGRALLRALIFFTIAFAFDLAIVLTLSRFNVADHALNGVTVTAVMTIPLLLLFATARRANGWMAIHDCATRSRVVQRSASPIRPAVPAALERANNRESSQIGPYHILELLGPSNDGEMFLGYDARLLRKVWIRKVPDGTPPVRTELRRLSRPGRLRWLAGRRAPGDSWDAYEGISGKSLAAVTAAPAGWDQVRFWLLDLATELQLADEQQVQNLRLSHVWISEQAGVKLLDFPAPVESGPNKTEAPEAASSPHEFLFRVALSAFPGESGQFGKPPAAGTTWRIPLPLHARAILNSIRDGGDLKSICSQLKQSLGRPVVVTPLRRLVLFLAALWTPVFLTVLVMLADAAPRLKSKAELSALQTCLSRLESLPADSDATDEREALETYIAGRFPSVITNSWAMAQGPAEDIDRHEAAAKQILQSRGEPSAGQFALAKELVENEIPAIRPEPRVRMRSIDPETRWVWIIGLASAYGLCTVILPGWIAALAFRGGVLLRAFGLAIVTKSGEPASRARALWRNFIASLPFVLATYTLHGGDRWLSVLPLCIALALAFGSALIRGRTLQDRLAGTVLVTR